MAIIENFTARRTSIATPILQGDCLNILPTLPARSVDFILTDPPYITRYKSRDGRTVPNDDNDRWLKPAFARDVPRTGKQCFLRQLLRLAAGGQVPAGIPRRWLPRRRTLRLPEALHLPLPLRALSA